MPLNLLVMSNPDADYLQLLERLPQPVNVRIGNDAAFIATHAPTADVILSDIGGGSLEAAFSLAKNVKWVHALSAGVDKILFPALIESPVPLTNSRGVFKDALAEFAMGAILFFAKDLRRLVRQQESTQWDQFDVQMIRTQTLGIVGYGEIGRETARLATALGMQVLSVRSSSTRAELHAMLAASDYVAVSTPLTPQTRGMIGAAELAAMKRTAVLINIGRGPVVVESALIAALETGQIGGAALDVFDIEPLPAGHPYYALKNVLLSPHSADHAVGWTTWTVLKFIDNFERFVKGEPLDNVVNKHAGY